jgi:hypothetical protein
MFFHYLFLRIFVFISAVGVTISSVTQACAWSTFVGLQSFLTLCRHVTIIFSPPPSQSHHPWPTAVALTLFTAPRRCSRHGHITPGPMPLRSRCSRPPAIVAIVVTSPPAQRRCPTLFTAPRRCCRRGHITPGPPPSRSHR